MGDPFSVPFILSWDKRITRHYIMHVSFLHLNRLSEDHIPFKTELRVRLVDDDDLARVEFRNTLIQTDKTRLLCKLQLTLPSRKMLRAVSITNYFRLEHFICSRLLSAEKFWVSYLQEFSQCLTNPQVLRSKSFAVCQTLLSKHYLSWTVSWKHIPWFLKPRPKLDFV